ncbi:MAG: L,D-transpeptidase family protein [Xanthobacteraceae bacterium]|nr:L,D-transpeptidase family protein [Xanthobacteraceae bacterium]
MRNDSMSRRGTGRGGFDRVLMAVAATFLTVSASSALAQTAPAADNATEQAIDAGVPMPDTSLVPPPTAVDVGTTAPAPTAADAKPASADAAETTASTTPATAPSASVTETPAAPREVATPAAEPAAAPAASEPVKAAATAAPADQPVADALRDTLQTRAAKFFSRKNERAAVEKFYAARDYAPLWTEGGALTARAKAVVSRLNDAAADGLDPAEYPVPNFAAATGPDALADADLKLTASMLDYARQAQSGQMHWSQVSADIQYPEHPVDPNEVLANVTTAKDASSALQAYNPPHKLYKELRAKLAELRGQAEGPVTLLPEGPALSLARKTKKNPHPVAMEDTRVPQLRAKLGVTENPDDTRYDAAVAAAVRKFQAHAGLKATGVLDDRTVKAINSPKRDREIDTIVVNMERWRWLPRQLGAASLGDAYAILNIPDFTLKVMQNGAEVWKTRVVVGKPGKHATPLLTETMKYITVNPTWNVPPSIINNEYLPALQQDPTVLERMGLKLEQNRDGTIHISQPPGERNALGRIRFNFPNKFLVYQHDTPDKGLFSRDVRAFSHGCMRVQNPDQYAAILLNIAMPDAHYTPEKIRAMYGTTEHDIKFATPIPVNITYQTAFVDDAGKLHIRPDIYGRDAAMLALLRNGKNKNLEAVVAHAQPNYSRPRAQLPVAANDRFGFGNDSGPNFFERLFGIPTQAPPPAAEYGQRRRIYR